MGSMNLIFNSKEDLIMLGDNYRTIDIFINIIWNSWGLIEYLGFNFY